MTTRSSAIPPPSEKTVPDTPELIEERRQKLVDYFEDCHVRGYETYISIESGLILYTDSC